MRRSKAVDGPMTFIAIMTRERQVRKAVKIRE